MKNHAVELIVDEIFEAKELDGAQVSPIAPINIDFDFSTAIQVKRVPEIPTRLTHGFPSRLTRRYVIQSQNSHDFV